MSIASMRHPDQILADFDLATTGKTGIQPGVDPREILHEAIADVLDTAERAVLACVSDADLRCLILGAFLETEDYLVNFYGDS